MSGTIPIGLKTSKDFFIYTLAVWIMLLFIGVFIFKTGLFAPISLIFIALIFITILVYILGKR